MNVAKLVECSEDLSYVNHNLLFITCC